MTIISSEPSGSTSTTDDSGKTTTNTTYITKGTIPGCTVSAELLDDPYTAYNPTDTIGVYTKLGDCTDARVDIDNTKPVGILLVVIAVLIILFTVINLFFVRKYKGVAAVEGAAGAFNLVRGLFGK